MKRNLFILMLLFCFLTLKAQTPNSPIFSVGRGFYDSSFTVSLSTTTAGAEIRYTTDGTQPTLSSPLYSDEISITTTTPLSAAAFLGDAMSPIVTHTYLFIKDIVNQPVLPDGYPDRWGPLNYAVASYKAGENAPADYEMDASVCNSPEYKDLISEAFMSIPFVAIVTNKDNIFSHSTDEEAGGIYIYTGDTGNPSSNGGTTLGREWERPTSIEFFDPVTGNQVQQNCGLRLHGGNSRKPYNTGKHSFRISFRKEYGEGKLRFPIFDNSTATDKYDHLVLRAGYNYSWTKNSDEQQINTQYVYDSFAKRTQLDLGYVACHDRFVHLFINGLYWGLYNLSEKINDNFMDSYLGGSDSDYDVINDDGIVDGDMTAYNQMIDLAKSGKYDDLISNNLLFMENFIDYMLLNFYIGNNDWGTNNWFVGRSRVNPRNGFMFFSWDAENAFTDVNINKIKGSSGVGGPLREILFGSTSTNNTSSGLFKNKVFKDLLAQRAGILFTGEGELTAQKSAARYTALCDEIDLPIILESARWGDFRSKVMPHGSKRVTYTRNDHWEPRKQELLANYFPKRTAKVLEQLAEIGITPIMSRVVDTESNFRAYFADNCLYFNLPTDKNVGIEVYSVDGKLVFKKNYVYQSTCLHKEDLQLSANGVFIYRISFDNHVYSGKFVK